MGVAGNIRTPQDATRAMEEDIDWIMLGRAAILNHNFPELYADNPEFETPIIPVSVEYLAGEGLSQNLSITCLIGDLLMAMTTK